MRFRDMLRLRMARTAPDKLPPAARPRRLRTHCVEPLEGRQLLSSLPQADRLPEAASWSIALANDPPRDGDRTFVIAKVAEAAQDGTLAAILPSSTGVASTPPLADDRGALLVTAHEVVSGLSTAAPDLTDPGAPDDGRATAVISGLTSLVQARLDASPGSEGWVGFPPGHAALEGMIDLPPLFALFRDPPPLPVAIHSDMTDGLSMRDADVDLLILSNDPTTPAPVAVEPMGGEDGAPSGPEDFVTVPVAGPGMVRGLLVELAGRGRQGPPVPSLSPGSPGLAGDDPGRDSSAPAELEVAAAPDEMSAQDEAGLIDGAIADVEAALSRGADLLASFSPFDRVALEQTIDQFLDEVGDLGAVLSNLEVTANLLPNLMAAAGAIGAIEAVRRRFRGPSDEEADDPEGDGDAGSPALPGLPRGWALEEL